MDAITVSGTARTATLPAGHRETPAAVWFQAETSAGPLRLCAAGAAPHAAAAAIALQRCELLLDALDVWTGLALDWRWLAAPPANAAPAGHACVHWDPSGDSDAGACRLELPWGLLRLLPAPPAPLAQRLHWQEVAVVLAVAQFRLGREELVRLEPGGAVVLPASLRSSWHGLLRALDAPALPSHGVPVALAAPWMARRISASAGGSNDLAAPDAADTWPARAGGSGDLTAVDGADAWRTYEVRLETPRPLPADRLAAWFEGDLSEVGPRAALWRCAAGHEAAKLLATGRLMPWADGWALAVETLIDDIQHTAAVI
ncbi:MAG TPA: hypothetical protein VFR86_08060 [Burkholderiaceae bacterium]|nr:hypothetical protein [Burkholderiaceae bacterium]